jgi:mannobiose 2-epimerase
LASVQSDTAWARRIEAELQGNILPFWIAHAVDRENGGFYGALTNDLRVNNDVERSAVLCARILWTYAAAYRRYGDDAYLQMARYAYDYLTGPFLDRQYGGVYWSVDRHGRPLVDRKHGYAQAFAIYGLSEFHRATGDPEAFRLAQEIFHLVDAHTYDPVNGGNLEGASREWGALADRRLSPVAVNSPKSMNTMLHLMEAYTNLLRTWNDATLRARLRDLLSVFLHHIIDPDTHHCRLYFDERWRWRHLSETVSYGHDIEGSWLLVEAADVLGDPDGQARARTEAVAMADRVYAEALEPDGGLLYESDPSGAYSPHADQKQWWAQAEAVVGFYNAYQISGEARFAEASARCWGYIESKLVDRVHGDWFKVLDRNGAPDPNHQWKIGPWECPYHHSRACMEMLTRLKQGEAS